MTNLKLKQCKVCDKTFIAKSLKRIYCKNTCRDKAYKANNPGKAARRIRDWRAKNKEIIRNNTSIEDRLAANLRSRLSKAIKRNQKTVSLKQYLGCSLDELRSYLESQFTIGMTWDNYGEWHIDHIKPLVKFNLLDANQLMIACNYKNLQPLWWQDNLSKGSK